MSLYRQPLLLELEPELIIDGFSGGGGAGSGIEQGLGRPVDVAMNHDPAAVAMHRVNHPQTRHLIADIFEVCPVEATGGRRVGFAWFSPDCTFYSKARGGKPIRHKHKRRRGLAWVIRRWVHQAPPRVITLENVEEFLQWGPLIAKRCKKTGRVIKADGTVAEKGERVQVQEQLLIPDPKRAGETFRQFVAMFHEAGYQCDWRMLRGRDYGAPTIRKRLFFIARRDGRPIVWPEATHVHKKVAGRTAKQRKAFFEAHPHLKPYRTMAECIDWSVPMLSIFANRQEAKAWGKENGRGTPIRPLADNTRRRIARGVMRYVLGPDGPFLVALPTANLGLAPLMVRSGQTGGASLSLISPVAVSVAHGEGRGKTARRGRGCQDLTEPHSSIVGKGDVAIVAPVIGTNTSGHAPTHLSEPSPTLSTGGQQLLFAPMAVPRYGEREGQAPRCRSVEDGVPTVVNTDNGSMLAAAHLMKFQSDSEGQPVDESLGTVTANSAPGGHVGGAAPFGIAAAQISTYYGGPGGVERGADLEECLPTQGTENRFGLVATMVAQNNEGFNTTSAKSIEDSASTITSRGANQSLIGISIVKIRGTSTDADPADPADTVSAGGNHHGLVATYMNTANNGWDGRAGRPAEEPSGTVCAEECRQAVVAVSTAAYYGTDQAGDVTEPGATITTKDRHAVVATHVQRDFGASVGHSMEDPAGTMTSGGGGKAALVGTLLSESELAERFEVDEWGNVVLRLRAQTKVHYGPIRSVPKGEYAIVDILMRMLEPGELYLAQGFRKGYVYEWGIDADGNRVEFTKAEQVRMCGNSVCPPVAEAIVRANVPEMIARPELKAFEAKEVALAA